MPLNMSRNKINITEEDISYSEKILFGNVGAFDDEKGDSGAFIKNLDQEVKTIASFIAELDPNIPYALLGFHGDFLMADLPPTSWKQAEDCFAAAKAAGLKRVRIGSIHILH